MASSGSHSNDYVFSFVILLYYPFSQGIGLRLHEPWENELTTSAGAGGLSCARMTLVSLINGQYL